ncbi:hypothetical protein OPV22_011074 [Ensete ventricosum]|uniref:Calponin-homology (CH) domain-containing protein n=1 Tax=Ensete ventricosum TaxID=4639 RepID=A0AAV8RMM4_ENSVE|nr:hypothetical protein OPV22_011074 [Ensete ventricosum]
MTDGLTSRAPPHTPSTPATAEGVGSSVSVHVPRKEASGSHTSCETPFTIYRPSRPGNQPINIPVDPALHRREVDETLLGEEAALRRCEAAGWLESILGPLGLSPQPAEKEFTSCLRSDIVLCNEINKIQPGAVLKLALPGTSNLYLPISI